MVWASLMAIVLVYTLGPVNVIYGAATCAYYLYKRMA